MVPLLYIRREVFRVPQAAMAAIAGVGQSTVSKWERGHLEPARNELERIRSEAIKRGLPWQDAWFFAAPLTKPEVAA